MGTLTLDMATEFDSIVLPNGHTIRRGTEVVVRTEIVGFGDDEFAPGDVFTIESIELDEETEEIVLSIGNVEVDEIGFGSLQQNGFVGFVADGAFVILPD